VCTLPVSIETLKLSILPSTFVRSSKLQDICWNAKLIGCLVEQDERKLAIDERDPQQAPCPGRHMTHMVGIAALQASINSQSQFIARLHNAQTHDSHLHLQGFNSKR
jgi:hypothetical protein